MTEHRIIQGNAVDALKGLASESVSCVITSPPYFALRCYLAKDHPLKPLEIGLEETPEQWLEKLWAVFDEVKRVCREDGVCFVNLGDTYNSAAGGYRGDLAKVGVSGGRPAALGMTSKLHTDYPPKCLMMLPERFALGMIERGWVLRNKIIYAKRNSMPSSVKDRFSNRYEFVYFFVKSRRYWFDLDAVRRQYSPSTHITQHYRGTGQKDYKAALVQDASEVKRRVLDGIQRNLARRKTADEGLFKPQAFNVRVRDSDKNKFTQKAAEWEKKAYDKRGMRQSPEPGEPNAFHPMGANPGDVIDERQNHRPTYGEWLKEQERLGKYRGRRSETDGRGFGGEVTRYYAEVFGTKGNPLGANPGDVVDERQWEGDDDVLWLATQSRSEAHFATFSDKLVEHFLKAGCPRAVCANCGMARVRIARTVQEERGTMNRRARGKATEVGSGAGGSESWQHRKTAIIDVETLGWSQCPCPEPDYRPGLALDPFCGRGTVSVIAKRLGRSSIGIDLNLDYAAMAEANIEAEPEPQEELPI